MTYTGALEAEQHITLYRSTENYGDNVQGLQKNVSNWMSHTTVWELLVNTATLVSGANDSGNNVWLTQQYGKE